jgi:hypothetical protein
MKKSNKKNIHFSPVNNQSLPPAGPGEQFDFLLEQRAGGSLNITGIKFQLLYAAHLILTKICASDLITIRLEGIEDIDLYLENSNEFIQVKTSRNIIDANAFWNMGVLQNFLKTYEIAAAAKFRFVHNSSFTKGKLAEIATGKLTHEIVAFWAKKLHLPTTETNNEAKDFLSQISFEKISEAELEKEITNTLLEKYEVNNDTEHAYRKALFYNIFEWSKQRATISNAQIEQLIQSVRDSFSKFPVNPALQNTWIESVLFQQTDQPVDLRYYDGKAAKPADILSGLPMPRPLWQKAIEENIANFDITVIKSSSGQGKTTLAWMASYEMAQKGYSVYQVRHCISYDEAASIIDFIKSRIRIGQKTLIIIDGLDQAVSHWYEIAEILAGCPIKIIITSREEDWIRYGSDISKIALNFVNIKLEISEAGDIFNELKKKNRLHSSIKTWQPAWEKVKDKGLLIEFIYLITQGEMLADRLRHQVTTISAEPLGKAKIEILRLITLADVLNLKIYTNSLTKYVASIAQVQFDQNELSRQLEREYYIKFSGRLVEGLHPVRSKHLVTILHSNSSVQDSLISLLSIIDEDQIYEYFINAPIQFDLDDTYYKEASGIMATREFPKIVYAIDGIMHSEPYRFWQTNKIIFDDISERGLDLFVYDAIPFNKQNTLRKLVPTLPTDMASNPIYLIKKLDELTPYSIENSAVFRFITYLSIGLTNKPKFENIEGLTFLYKWFNRVGVAFPNVIKVNENDLLYSLRSKKISEASEFFHFFSLANPESYKKFIDVHRAEIIAHIKIKTNTLSIFESDNDINLEYILDKNPGDANEQSVYRINIIHAFFPYYDHYCTKAIVLPFPNEDIYKYVVENSIKKIPAKNLGDDFDIHINQIWAKTILDQYSSPSSYDWQKDFLALRKNTIELAKKTTRFFEASLEGNPSRARTLLKELIRLSEAFFKKETAPKSYPANSKKYFEKKSFSEEEKAISDFTVPFRNFINQLSGLINPQNDQDSNLPLINIKSAVNHLSRMQTSYETIAAHKYFPTDSIIKEETTWLPRLSATAEFYVNHFKSPFDKKIVVAGKTIKEWVEKEEKRKLSELIAIISGYEKSSPFKFYFPNKIVDKDSLKYATIAVQGFDHAQENDLWDFSIGLRDLSATGVHFFTFLFIDANKQLTGALRFQNHYFEKFKLIFETGTFDDNWENPLPLVPDSSMLTTLEGITLKVITIQKKDESFYQMMCNVWKLIEYRKRLNVETPLEKEWLGQIELEYDGLIRGSISTACSNEHGEIAETQLVNAFLEKKELLSQEKIIEIMTRRGTQDLYTRS